MRILHTADLHFGQNIYYHYDRLDEHLHFFSQLKKWIETYSPDALIISGDIFHVPQPSAAVWRAFNAEIVELRHLFPSLAIIILAGNHDSASRIESHSKVWDLGGITVIGTPPPLLPTAIEGWEEHYMVRLQSGFVIAIPYMSSERSDTMIHLQEYVAKQNKDCLPVVMTGHLTVLGSDLEGHNMDIGNIKSVDIERLGDSYDYLALGHIHKPQTIGYPIVYDFDAHSYQAPVARYSGSVLHVSEDENYPHSVSLVDIDKHGGEVTIKQLKIEELRHFHILPIDRPEPFASGKEALSYLKKYMKKYDNVYFKLRFEKNADIPSNFNSSVYDLIEKSGKDVRYNPRKIFVASAEEPSDILGIRKAKIDVEEIKQMSDPKEFIRKTAPAYPGLTADEIIDLFSEVEEELKKKIEEK